jgi:uncharacterized circularly permuted ATP-grasp superfamily protein/uncharacterized alpha-E superfamily protein
VTPPDECAGPHAAPLGQALAALGPAELARRWQDARHLLRENGVTYTVYAADGGAARPWQLDPLPLPLDGPAFDRLAAGLTQRARLLELVLRDLYGPRRLLADGLVPPELVFANPAFLRPCHGVSPVGGRHLLLAAATVGRDAAGNWRVLSDRTQAPSGAGYALENRLVLARTLPEPFRDCRVRRLAPFFAALRAGLVAASPAANPRVVLLTPGPANETYFEHALLARYLGFTLVEGGDLTVRDDRVFLKVVGGLQPVDVIVRRLDDDFADPLELRPDSTLGVAGLLGAVRAGTVVVANALGSGLAESPGFLPFLPRLARALLGEHLAVPGADAWWAGDPTDRSHVLANLPELVVKPAFRASGGPVFAGDLSATELADLATRIRAEPWAWVAQERLPLSTAPVLHGDGPRPGRVVLRAFLAGTADGGWAVLPGGLVRVAGAADGPQVTNQAGGGSKDAWVPADGPVPPFTLLPPAAGPVALTRAGGDLPSRAADNLFWLGRYAERADGRARVLRAVLAREPDAPDLPVLEAAAGPDPAAGLATALGSLVRAGSLCRDRLSADLWRALADLSDAADLRTAHTLGERMDRLNHIILLLAAVGGLAVESMTRGEGWRFLNLGRNLERALHTVALLNAALRRPATPEGPVLEAVLEVADSSLTYRRRYLGALRAEAVLDLLVCDESNPRAVAARLANVTDDLARLPRPAAGHLSPEERLALAASSAVRLADPDRLAVVVGDERPALAGLLDHLNRDLPAVSDALSRQYLSHLEASRQLAGP